MDRIRVSAEGVYTTAVESPADLRPRHQETLKLLAQGLNNAEIARRMYIQEQTVKNYVTAIYEALGLPVQVGGGNRVRAALWFWSHRE